MDTDPQDIVSPDSNLAETDKFIPLPVAAFCLQVSPRQLKALLRDHNLSLYSFGSKSKRVAEGDLLRLINASVIKPKHHEVAS
jgi:hypothetical protein